MMKMLGSGRTVTEVKRQVQTCTSQDICKELFIWVKIPKKRPHSSHQGHLFGFKKRVFLYPHTENVTPFIPAQITNPPLVFFFPVSFVFHSLLWSATCTEWFNLVWWEQPARKETEGEFAWLITTPSRVVPDSGSLSEGHRDHWDTQWVPFTITWHRGLALDTDPWLC